ncbi:uncharacterized protein IWZ02DRAFT_521625 [Phyllosticta citriasiana]|uniref:uncharacterized protein n=1 Tax=Phyllosticta citriasiana TaxID=595635 RepID=UPI0030FD53DD
MALYQTLAQHLALKNRCVSPMSSSVDVPASARPKTWRNGNCPTTEIDDEIDKLCDRIEDRLDLYDNPRENSSDCSNSPKFTLLTFEEKVKKFQTLRNWVKDRQMRYVEKQSFYDKDGKRIGKKTCKKPRYKLENKAHSKAFKTAGESIAEETPVKKASPKTTLKTVRRKLAIKKASSKTTGKSSSGKASSGKASSVKASSSKISSGKMSSRMIPGQPTGKTSIETTAGKDSETPVKEFANNESDDSDKTIKPTVAMRPRRDSFLRRELFED